MCAQTQSPLHLLPYTIVITISKKFLPHHQQMYSFAFFMLLSVAYAEKRLIFMIFIVINIYLEYNNNVIFNTEISIIM